jgi:hypothetical protein
MSQAPRSSSGPERRKAARVPVGAHVTAHVEADAQSVTLRDISLGGFLLESTQPFHVDAIHQFRIATATGWETVVTARSVHCRQAAGSSVYLTGFAFVDPTGPEAERRIHQLIDKVSSVVAY